MLVPSATLRARTEPYGVRTAMPAPYGFRVEGGGVLVDPDAETEARPLQAPGELGRVEHGDAPAVVEAGLEGR